MAPNDPAHISTAEFNALKDRLASLEAREARRRKVLVALVVAGFVGAPLAMAADGNCPNGYPFCFTADSPAQASQVNHNFAQAREWLETKAGPVANVGISTRDLGVVSDAGVGGNLGVRNTLAVQGPATVGGTLSVGGTVSTGNLNVTGGVNVSNNILVQGTLQSNGNFYSSGNSHDDCYTTGYECGFLYCANGYYVVGVDIAENEACGGGGDYDFSNFALRCCRL